MRPRISAQPSYPSEATTRQVHGHDGCRNSKAASPRRADWSRLGRREQSCQWKGRLGTGRTHLHRRSGRGRAAARGSTAREQPASSRLAPIETSASSTARIVIRAASTRTAHRGHLHRTSGPRPQPPRVLRRHVLRTPHSRSLGTAPRPLRATRGRPGTLSSPHHDQKRTGAEPTPGTTHEQHGLKHRPATATRSVPMPPELVHQRFPTASSREPESSSPAWR